MQTPVQTPAEKPVEQPPAVPATPGSDLTGRVLGGFHVLRRLGQGGMGQVYLAEQVSLKRKVALKILRSDLAANPTALQRFKSEAEAIARVTHANIVQVYAIEQADGLWYMALEYVEGRNLSEHLARKGTPDLLLAMKIMRQVAAALQRSSELGIIHRDIKPENILITRRGEAKVTDFGLSRCLAGDQESLKLTQSGVTMGTPLYMSPEQVEGRPVDCRTDIYSFGVTCYHMLAGEAPFRGQSAIEVAMKHVNAVPEPLELLRPDLPPELCAIVHKMMAKEPAQRYQTAGEILKDLLVLQEGTTGLSSSLILPASSSNELSPVLGQPTTAPVRRLRSWLPWAVGASVVLAIVGGAALGFVIDRKEPEIPAAFHQGANAPRSPLAQKDVEKVNELLSPEREEQVLKAAFQRYRNPTTDSDVRTGLGLCHKLGLLYLSKRPLDDAEKFFGELEKSSQKSYRDFGQLGQALVLAFANQAARSNQKLQEWLGSRPQQRVKYLRENPYVAETVLRALYYNTENLGKASLPEALEHFRRDLLKPPRGKSGDKGAKKG